MCRWARECAVASQAIRAVTTLRAELKAVRAQRAAQRAAKQARRRATVLANRRAKEAMAARLYRQHAVLRAFFALRYDTMYAATESHNSIVA